MALIEPTPGEVLLKPHTGPAAAAGPDVAASPATTSAQDTRTMDSARTILIPRRRGRSVGGAADVGLYVPAILAFMVGSLSAMKLSAMPNRAGGPAMRWSSEA